jgi:hypothetical protein
MICHGLGRCRNGLHADPILAQSDLFTADDQFAGDVEPGGLHSDVEQKESGDGSSNEPRSSKYFL